MATQIKQMQFHMRRVINFSSICCSLKILFRKRFYKIGKFRLHTNAVSNSIFFGNGKVSVQCRKELQPSYVRPWSHESVRRVFAKYFTKGSEVHFILGYRDSLIVRMGGDDGGSSLQVLVGN